MRNRRHHDASKATATRMKSPVDAWLGRLWRGWLAVRFQLFERHRHSRLVIEYVMDHPLIVLPEVLNPRLFWTGEFMAQSLNERLVPSGSLALDMGTGTGIGAVFAARWAGRVIAIDINESAVRCARMNALLHGLEERMEVRHGDLFGPLGEERFDVVLFNPPYLRGEPKNTFERALKATDVVERFASTLGDHLAPGGHALVLLSSRGDERAFLDFFQTQGFSRALESRRELIDEVLSIYRFTPQEPNRALHEPVQEIIGNGHSL